MLCLLVMESAMIGVFCALDFDPLLRVLGGDADPDGAADRHLGRTAKSLRRAEVLHLHDGGSVFLLVAHHRVVFADRQRLHPGGDGPPFRPDLSSSGSSLAFAISFAIKVPMFPFHTWLPAAHVEAPTAGSVLLASVLLKMGTYGFLRFCAADHAARDAVSRRAILTLSVVGDCLWRIAGARAERLKKLVAYSSVGHMGFATLGIFALNAGGHRGRVAGDDQSRRHHRRLVHLRGHDLRAAAHARPRRRRRSWQVHARLRRFSRLCSACRRWRFPARTVSSANFSC
jgi:NADH-quinone oxidoreductase subunit M